jgi:hypothetical protein
MDRRSAPHGRRGAIEIQGIKMRHDAGEPHLINAATLTQSTAPGASTESNAGASVGVFDASLFEEVIPLAKRPRATAEDIPTNAMSLAPLVQVVASNLGRPRESDVGESIISPHPPGEWRTLPGVFLSHAFPRFHALCRNWCVVYFPFRLHDLLVGASSARATRRSRTSRD